MFIFVVKPLGTFRGWGSSPSVALLSAPPEAQCSAPGGPHPVAPHGTGAEGGEGTGYAVSGGHSGRVSGPSRGSPQLRRPLGEPSGWRPSSQNCGTAEGLPGPTEPNYQNKPATTTCRGKGEREGGREGGRKREEVEKGERKTLRSRRVAQVWLWIVGCWADVQQAAHFNSAAHQRKCTQEVTLHPTRILSSGGRVSVNILSEACSGGTNEISNLEHVQVTVSISAVCRGDLSISLQSPGGTVSLLLDTRPNDASTDGLINWTLMTVHCWGEQARGSWSLQVTDHKGTVRGCGRLTEEEAAGALLAVTLILYGTYHPHQTTHGVHSGYGGPGISWTFER
ncbi:unnamed protein product [Pleuronectes platessa]|uniref:P/Homo B domain-containing protein n=1 Tax=Pleuronectes platessa TaxID=8262 RepID=A0A9N7YSB2_PLEPL|nr:unnamed protein product [Pleuronectes platessa]